MKRLQLLAKEGSGIVRLSWAGNALKLSARAQDVGESTVTTSCVIEHGVEGEIAYNINYLAKYMGGIDGMATMEVSSPSSPGRFTAASTPQLLMMPMFVAREGKDATKGEPPKAEAPAEATEPSAQEPGRVQEEAARKKRKSLQPGRTKGKVSKVHAAN